MSVDWEGSAAGQPSPLATQMPIEAARQLRSRCRLVRPWCPETEV